MTKSDAARDESRQAELFRVLGVESRIRILELLKRQGPLGVNQLSEALGITPSAVSQHLKTLRYAGLVARERKGYRLPYEIDHAAMDQCRELLTRVCTCGCRERGLVCGPNSGKADEELRLLKKYERDIREELEKVQARIKEITP